MPKSMQTIIAMLLGGGALGTLHALFEPDQCAAFLHSHGAVASVGGAVVAAVALWFRSPAENK